MALVKVHNDNYNEKTGKGYPFTQNYRGRHITIEAGKYIEMEYDDAEDFLGLISPIVLDANDNPKPESYKQLRIEKPSNFLGHVGGKFQCHVCSFNAPNMKSLQAHCDANHMEDLVPQPELENQIDQKVLAARERLSAKMKGA